MSKTTTIHARIEPSLKAAVEDILKTLGLSASEAIALFYRQIALHRGMPFELKIPNRKTRKAIREAQQGKHMRSYASLDEFMDKFQ